MFQASNDSTTRQSKDWSFLSSSGLYSTRQSSDSFAVTSVNVPGMAIPEAENESVGADSVSVKSDNSMHMSHSGGSDHSSSMHASTVPSNMTRRQLEPPETKVLLCCRGILYLLLVTGLVVLSIQVHRGIEDMEEDFFKDWMEDQSQHVFSTVEGRLTNLLTALEQWSFQYTPLETPYRTIPNYDSPAASFLQLSHASWHGMVPLVAAHNFSDWQDYSQSHADLWLNETISNIRPQNSQDWACPLWQHYPTDASLVNWDMHALETTIAQELQLALADSPTIVLGQATDFDWMTSTEAPNNMIYFPTDNSGSILAWMDWQNYLQTPLDSMAVGMVFALENPCQEVQAYQLVESDEDITLEYLSTTPKGLREFEKTLEIAPLVTQIVTSLATNMPFQLDYCPYTLHIYPTHAVRDRHVSNEKGHTVAIVLFFVSSLVTLIIFDVLIMRRHNKVMKSALKSHEIVASLFPENVRTRLFGESINFNNNDNIPKKPPIDQNDTFLQAYDPNQNSVSPSEEYVTPQRVDLLGRRMSYERNGNSNNSSTGRPIADLFPHTTVLFADIAGFTAWSSVRDPSQVFTLLETIYAAFDKVALHRRVFKVETIGDCYVAVTGLPNPQEDHAVRMVKFAKDCQKTMQRLTQGLEVELGPDTGDLCVRFGMHSGPVTAGVLRGQKSRFQLFGDTVNTASRMESNGLPNQIQCSQQTADLLIEAGKTQWIHARKDLVHAKGKGNIQTYWVIASKGLAKTDSQRSMPESGESDDESDITEEPVEDLHNSVSSLPKRRPTVHSEISPHLKRLIDWNVDILARNIKAIVAHRKTQFDPSSAHHKAVADLTDELRMQSEKRLNPGTWSDSRSDSRGDSSKGEDLSGSSGWESEHSLMSDCNPREEYSELVRLPHFDPSRQMQPEAAWRHADLEENVKEQLDEYVTMIACAYNDNPFHNFEHASHVTMSANKILKRVVNAENLRVRRTSLDNLASKLHDYTYGITSDPLTHFACLFSAMIHDVDHPGVSNAQMLKEDHPLSVVYDGKSIAEQHSFDFAWELLMEPNFVDLRACLFETDADLKRFRQLVINSIMATDVFDRELVRLRNDRWRKAFPRDDVLQPMMEQSGDGTVQPPKPKKPDSNRRMDLKATIVIEHIIQAADVSHTMQHWHVYQKWNRRLFEEQFAAFCGGRGNMDPAKSWYKGELWFYDNYIIPLAKKLDECQVFGSASNEFLSYAMDNRSEWEAKGEDIVERLIGGCTHQTEEFMLMELAHEDDDEFKSNLRPPPTPGTPQEGERKEFRPTRRSSLLS